MTYNELENIANKIFPLVVTKECFLWIGAGISKPSGYPEGWNIVYQICEKFGVEVNSEKKSNEYLMEKLDECKEVNFEEYNQHIKEIFKDTNVDRRAYNIFLTIPFCGYITTNFDSCLKEIAEIANRRVDEFIVFTFPNIPYISLSDFRQVFNQKKPIFYIHGIINNSEKENIIVYSFNEFKNAYNGIVDRFLEVLFTFFPIVFTGSRITEPQIQHYLEKSKQNQETLLKINPQFKKSQKLLILCPNYITEIIKNGEKKVRLQNNEEFEKDIGYYRHLGLDVVVYNPTDSHPEIEKIFNIVYDLSQLKSQQKEVSPQSYFEGIE